MGAFPAKLERVLSVHHSMIMISHARATLRESRSDPVATMLMWIVLHAWPHTDHKGLLW